MADEDPSLGFLKLEIKFEAPPKSDKTVGILHVNIREGRNLVPTSAGGTADPYVKLYLSKDGKDLKTTKQKTAHQRATVDPLFEERLVVYLAHGITLDDSYRLQVTVWDNGGRLASNECMGGLSFSLGELASAPVAGWYQLLPEPLCRATNEPVQGPIGETFSLQRSGSTRSLSIAPKGFRRMTGSFRKSISKLTGKEGHGGSMMDLSSAGTSKGKSKDTGSATGSPASVKARFGLLSRTGDTKKNAKDKDVADAPGNFGERVAHKADAPATRGAAAAAAGSSGGGGLRKGADNANEDEQDEDEDDRPRDFGGRVVRAPTQPSQPTQPTHAADDDDEEIFIDDDGPGNFGARVEPKQALKAAEPVSTLNDENGDDKHADDGEDDDDGPGDFGGRVVRSTGVSEQPQQRHYNGEDEDGEGEGEGEERTRTPDGVPVEKPSVNKASHPAPALKLAQPAPPTDDVDDDDDPEGQLPQQPQSYHGSSSSIDRLGSSSASRAVPSISVSNAAPVVEVKKSPLGGRSDQVAAPTPTLAPTPTTATANTTRASTNAPTSTAPTASGIQAPAPRASISARKESVSSAATTAPTNRSRDVPEENGAGRRMSATLRASHESLSSITTKASRDVAAQPKEPPTTTATATATTTATTNGPPSRLTKEPSASAVQSARSTKDSGVTENGNGSRTPEDPDSRGGDEGSLRRKKMPQPGTQRRSAAISDESAKTVQLEAEVATLRKREQDLQHRVNALEEELQAQTNAAEMARTELDSMQAKGKDPKRDLDKLQQLTKVQEEVRRLRSETREAREQRDQALLAQKALEDKLEQLVKGQEALKLAGLEQLNAKLTRQIESTASKADDLEEENRELRHYIDRLLVQLLELDPKAIERAALPGK